MKPYLITPGPVPGEQERQLRASGEARHVREPSHVQALEGDTGGKRPEADLQDRAVQARKGEQQAKARSSPAELLSPDPVDEVTPDAWVPRSRSLRRLTGRHPYNAEPELTALVHAGFVTPSHLHFVRNHGAVPKLDWDSHKIEIKGLASVQHQPSHDQQSANTGARTVEEPAAGPGQPPAAASSPKAAATSAPPGTVSLSMADLTDTSRFPSFSIAVTLTCDGNRRKELNMMRRTRGFNWGPAATGCAVWTGVRLCDLLQSLRGPPSDCRYVWFEGADQLTGGAYAASLPIHVAMDSTSDLMLAYHMNGQPLPPDHGYPVRLVVPGYVGGRSVKWLKSITLSKEQSRSHWQWHDHKMLPAEADSSAAAEEGHWYNPDYSLMEHNVSSVVARPAHGEVIRLGDRTGAPRRGHARPDGRMLGVRGADLVALPVLNKPLPPAPTFTAGTAPDTDDGTSSTGQAGPSSYLVSGWAFSGGGRPVAKVEVSLDGGKSWRLAQREYPSQEAAAAVLADGASQGSGQSVSGQVCPPRPGGRYWTWCHWHLPVPLPDLARASDIRVRAFDSSMNTQPCNRIWNVTGMMNNAVYSVHVRMARGGVDMAHGSQGQQAGGSKDQAVASTGEPVDMTSLHSGPSTLLFLHPVVAGVDNGGGWVEMPVPLTRQATAGATATQRRTEDTLDKGERVIDDDELARHTSETAGVWMALGGGVYDVSSFLRDHPGGAAALLAAAGTDATALFQSVHGEDADDWKEGFRIGVLRSAVEAARKDERRLQALQRAHGARPAARPPAPHLQLKAVGTGRLPHLWTTVPPRPAAQWTAGQTADVVALHPRRSMTLTFLRKDILSADTRRFVFSREHRDRPFGLPVGQYVTMMADVDDRLVARPYTPVHPIVAAYDDGEVHFVIKVYRPDAKHGHGGVMSQHLDSLEPGHTVAIKGPAGHVVYEGWGWFSIAGHRMKVDRVAMVAGGTGITPLYQLLQAFRAELDVLRAGAGDAGGAGGVVPSESGDGPGTQPPPTDASPKTSQHPAATTPDASASMRPPQAWLVYSNHTEGDILLRHELDELAGVRDLDDSHNGWGLEDERHEGGDKVAGRNGTRAGLGKSPSPSSSNASSPSPSPVSRPISVWYVVSQAGHSDHTDTDSTSGRPWRYGVGHVDARTLREHLPPFDASGQVSCLALVCGPPGLLETAVLPVLDQDLGYRDDRLVEF